MNEISGREPPKNDPGRHPERAIRYTMFGVSIVVLIVIALASFDLMSKGVGIVVLVIAALLGITVATILKQRASRRR